MVFDCKEGSIYRIPANDNIKPIINLAILKNLGHNSIKTRCLDCGTVDTYAKNELEKGTVFLCKTCGKNSIYETTYAKLTVNSVVNKETIPKVNCTCAYCNKSSEYLLSDLINGSIAHCKHCLLGLYVGRKYGKVVIGQYSISAGAVNLICAECNNKAGTFKIKAVADAIRDKKNIDRARKCGCVNKESTPKIQPKSVTSKPKSPNNPDIPSSTDDFYNIEPHREKRDLVIATCRNCDIRKTYSLQDILDGEPCSICKGLVVGDRLAKRDISDSELSKLRLTEEGKEHVVKMQKRYELNVSNTSIMKHDYIEARNTKQKYVPTIYCRCNNCNIENGYSSYNLDLDIKTCNVCDFETLVGSIVGTERNMSEKIVRGFKIINSRANLVLECTGCGVKSTLPKIDYKRVGIEPCTICRYKKQNGDSESIIGHLFKASESDVVNGYKRVGKFLVLEEDFNENLYNFIVQCTECGSTLSVNYNRPETFYEEFKNKECNKCATLFSSTRNFINNNNWTGYIKNCRIIDNVFTEDGIKKADVRCLLCNDVVTLPLTVFLYSDYCVCEKCMDKKIVMRCPSCKNVHDSNITLSDLYSDETSSTLSKKIICPVTKEKVNLSSFRLYQEEQSKLDFLVSKSIELEDIATVPGDGNLIRSQTKYYEGTDGNKYYTCYCKKHNKFMTLREDEMTVYDHLYCADTRMFGYM